MCVRAIDHDHASHSSSSSSSSSCDMCYALQGEKYVQPDITAFQFEKVGDPYAPRVVVIQKKGRGLWPPVPLGFGRVSLWL